MTPLEKANAQLDEMFDNLAIVDADENKFVKNDTKPIITGICKEWWNILTPDALSVESLHSTLNSIINTTIKPASRDIFNFARFTPPDRISVLILGQDPYHTDEHADGLAFSSKMDQCPPSLTNIIKALNKSGFKASHTRLTSWAAQGVLLLNTALTVLPGQPESHLQLWKPYMNLLLNNISSYYTSRGSKLVVMLWGKKAEQYENYFKNHVVLKYKHPSPLAGDFSDCPNFLECNNHLVNMGKTPINWNIDDSSFCEVYTDGSSYPNKTGPEVQSGYSAIFTAGQFSKLKLYGKTPNKPPYYSNNIRAEGTALFLALFKLSKLPAENRRVIHVITDCEFWIKMINEHIPNWVLRGGDNAINAQKNPDIVKELWKLYTDLRETSFIVFSHVYSHDKKKNSKQHKQSTEYRRFFYNKLADSLANHARYTLQNGDYGELNSPMIFDGESF